MLKIYKFLNEKFKDFDYKNVEVCDFDQDEEEEVKDECFKTEQNAEKIYVGYFEEARKKFGLKNLAKYPEEEDGEINDKIKTDQWSFLLDNYFEYYFHMVDRYNDDEKWLSDERRKKVDEIFEKCGVKVEVGDSDPNQLFNLQSVLHFVNDHYIKIRPHNNGNQDEGVGYRNVYYQSQDGSKIYRIWCNLLCCDDEYLDMCIAWVSKKGYENEMEWVDIANPTEKLTVRLLPNFNSNLTNFNSNLTTHAKYIQNNITFFEDSIKLGKLKSSTTKKNQTEKEEVNGENQFVYENNETGDKKWIAREMSEIERFYDEFNPSSNSRFNSIDEFGKQSLNMYLKSKKGQKHIKKLISKDLE